MDYCLIADGIILLILSVFLWRGKVNGFIKTFIRGFSWIAAYFCAKWFSDPVSVWLSQNVIYDKVCDRVGKALSRIDITGAVKEIVAAVPEVYANILEMMGVDLTGIVDSAVAKQENVLGNMTEAISSSLSLGISRILSFVLVFVAAIIVLRIAACVLDVIAKLPILNAINRLGGVLLGTLNGVLISWGVVQIGGMVINMFVPDLKSVLEQTYLVKFLYNVVPLDLLS